MLEYGFDGTIKVDGEEVDKADLWQQPGYVQEIVEDVIDGVSNDGKVAQLCITTKEGMEECLDEMCPSEHLSPEEQEAYFARYADERVAGLRARDGIDNDWFEKKYGEPFDFEAFKDDLRSKGVNVD